MMNTRDADSSCFLEFGTSIDHAFSSAIENAQVEFGASDTNRTVAASSTTESQEQASIPVVQGTQRSWSNLPQQRRREGSCAASYRIDDQPGRAEKRGDSTFQGYPLVWLS